VVLPTSELATETAPMMPFDPLPHVTAPTLTTESLSQELLLTT
jgi:hypothetical protein